MKVHKITVMVIDFDHLGATEVASTIENQRYPNNCIAPKVVFNETKDAGEWSDEHPLNVLATHSSEFARLFPIGEWQPIETFPEFDYEHHILFGDVGGAVSVIYIGFRAENNWYTFDGNDADHPNYWMPLPPPPKD